MLANARVIDGTGAVVERAHIVVNGGRIVAVSQEPQPPESDVEIDAGGMTVIPGLFDAHQHLFAHLAVANDSALASYISSADRGSRWSDPCSLPPAGIRQAPSARTKRGVVRGLQWRCVIPPRRLSRSDAGAEYGVDGIKFVFDAFEVDLDLSKIDHNMTMMDTRAMIESGVDRLEHGVVDERINADFARLMKVSDVATVTGRP